MNIKKIIRYLCLKLPARYVNQYISRTLVNIHNNNIAFSKYKNMYNGKEIAIIATGPSLNNYKKIKNVINIGVNKSFLNKNIDLDYIFMQDYAAINTYIEKINDKKYNHIIKFYGQMCETYYKNSNEKSKSPVIPESLIIKHNAIKYYIESKYPLCQSYFEIDIANSTIQDRSSVIFIAMQFALYTNPKKIYLVGCDCSSGYFDEKNPIIKPNKNLVKSWKELKKFAEIYYPETEIISVNPVGLKGVFKDWYQEDSRLG